MNTDDLVRALRQIRETRLLLIDLAWLVVKDDGSLDYEKMSFLAKELEEATKEAQAYGRATKEAVRCLREMVRS